MNIEQLKRESRLMDLFLELVEIPSPSLKEEVLAKKIIEILSIYEISAKKDSYGNVLAYIPPTVNCRQVPSLLLSAHMDVVGGSEPINVQLSACQKYVQTDGQRTLGADNKAGVAAIIDIAIELAKLSSEIEHGPIEIIFTRDEESGMSGIRNLESHKLSSEYAIIADGEYLGELDAAGAGFSNVYISVTEGKGGHSGINIDDKTRVNAVKALAEIVAKIPQGVFKKSDEGVVTSINAGAIIGGTAGTCISETIKECVKSNQNAENIPEKFQSKNVMQTIAQNSFLNVISQNAYVSYSVRSSEPENEKELLKLIKSAAKEIDDKYNGFIKISVDITSHLKPFVKSDDTFLTDIIIQSANDCEIESQVASFHAGAETHVLANEKLNSQSKKFKPVIIGVANLKNIHSSDERIDWKSFIKGREWLLKIVENFAKGNNA